MYLILQQQNMNESNQSESPSYLRIRSSIGDMDPEMRDQMADQFLAGGPGQSSRIHDYLEIEDIFIQVSPKEKRRTPETKMSVQPQKPVPSNPESPSKRNEDEKDIFSNIFESFPQGPAHMRRARNPQNGLCRDYQKNIPKAVTHMCCREFKKDILAKKGAKIRCKELQVSYDAFEALLRQIEKDLHISNKRLLTCYLQPQESDPQFLEKQVFAEYFDYFLRNCLNTAVQKSTGICNKPAYISYCRKYLVYLGVTGVQGNIPQDTRM